MKINANIYCNPLGVWNIMKRKCYCGSSSSSSSYNPAEDNKDSPGRALGLGLGLGLAWGLGLKLEVELELGSKCTMRRTFWANEEKKINKKHANISLANILTASLGPAHCPFGQPIPNNFHTKMFLFILGLA